jgi:hypothetical protein
MNLPLRVCSSLLALSLVFSPAFAVPITYEGSLALGVPGTGQVGGTGWLDEDASQVDFWRFVVPTGGLRVTIQGTRLNANLDPVLSVYAGVTSADTSLFRSEASWGGLTFIGVADDEIPNPGPGGDPLFTSGLLPASTYTVAIGGFLSAGAGPYPYSIVVAAAAIPTPGTLLLLIASLVALALHFKSKGATRNW